MPLPGEGVVHPRKEILDEIFKARQEQLAKEFQEGGGDITTLEPADRVEQPAEEKVEEAAPPEEKPETEAATETPPEKPKRKLKVDGQELEVEEEKIIEAGIATLQKQAAADKSLEEARRLRKEAQDEARRIVEEAKAQAKPNQDATPLPEKGATSVERLTDDHFIDAVKKIQYGSEAEASQALKGLIAEAGKAGKSPELTLNEVGEYLEFREATKWAHDEYKEILGDPKLKTLFSSEEKRLRAAGDMRPYREVYTDIGNGLREWLKEKTPAPAPDPKKDLTRHERKASIVTIPSAAARQPAPTQPKEPTPSEVIDRMRKARNQF